MNGSREPSGQPDGTFAAPHPDGLISEYDFATPPLALGGFPSQVRRQNSSISGTTISGASSWMKWPAVGSSCTVPCGKNARKPAIAI
jgi:hypothetical protein